LPVGKSLKEIGIITYQPFLKECAEGVPGSTHFNDGYGVIASH